MRLLAAFVLLSLASSALAEPNWQNMTLTAESTTRGEGVPTGKVTEHVWKDSKVFPGTIRRYWHGWWETN